MHWQPSGVDARGLSMFLTRLRGFYTLGQPYLWAFWLWPFSAYPQPSVALGGRQLLLQGGHHPELKTEEMR